MVPWAPMSWLWPSVAITECPSFISTRNGFSTQKHGHSRVQLAGAWSTRRRRMHRRPLAAIALSGALPPPVRVTPCQEDHAASNKILFGVTCNTLVRSIQSSSGPAGGASDGYGPGRGAAGPDRQCATTAARALRVIVQDGFIRMSDHAPPPEPIGNGGPESVRDG